MSSIILFKRILKFKKKITDSYYKFNTEIFLDKSLIKKVLIIKWGGMGDIVISLPIIESIAKHFPEAEIHLNTSKQWLPIFENDKRFSQKWYVDFKSHKYGWKGIFEWLRICNKNKYDVIFDLQTNDRSRLLITIIKYLNFHSNFLFGNHPVFPYGNRNYRKLENIHAFDIMKNAIESVGIKVVSKKTKIYTTHQNIKKVNFIIKQNQLVEKNFGVFICGSNKNGALKRWGVNNYFELSLLIKKFSEKIILIGGPDDETECRRIAQLDEHIINLCNKIDLVELPLILDKAKWIVSNDTGPAHFAACTNTPTLLITGPTNPALVIPINTNITAIQADIECRSCYRKICSHHSCMLGLSAQKVLPFFKEINGG